MAFRRNGSGPNSGQRRRRAKGAPIAKENQVIREVAKRPCGSAVGRLLDSSTKKSFLVPAILLNM